MYGQNYNTEIRRIFRLDLRRLPSVLLSLGGGRCRRNDWSRNCVDQNITVHDGFYRTVAYASAVYAIVIVSVCLFVCLSVTLVDCVETLNVSTDFLQRMVPPSY